MNMGQFYKNNYSNKVSLLLSNIEILFLYDDVRLFDSLLI